MPDLIPGSEEETCRSALKIFINLALSAEEPGWDDPINWRSWTRPVPSPHFHLDVGPTDLLSTGRFACCLGRQQASEWVNGWLYITISCRHHRKSVVVQCVTSQFDGRQRARTLQRRQRLDGESRQCGGREGRRRVTLYHRAGMGCCSLLGFPSPKPSRRDTKRRKRSSHLQAEADLLSLQEYSTSIS